MGDYIAPTARGFFYASRRGTKSEVVHKLAGWPYYSFHFGVPSHLERGTKKQVAHKWAGWLRIFCRVAPPNASKPGTKTEVVHKGAG